MYQLVNITVSAKYCDICGNDFDENQNGVIVRDVGHDLNVCRKHVPEDVQLGQTFEMEEEKLVEKTAEYYLNKSVVSGERLGGFLIELAEEINEIVYCLQKAVEKLNEKRQ